MSVTATEVDKKVEHALHLIEREYHRAMEKFPHFRTRHEGYAVILEELDEMWDEIKTDSGPRSCHEAVQVAAMCIKYIVAFEPGKETP